MFKKSRKIRILVVDDHPLIRKGLTLLINENPKLTVFAEAGTATQALSLVRQECPDMMIVDVALDGTSGIDLVKEVKEICPSMPILVLSVHQESLYAERALRAGALGYVMKQEATETLLFAIQRVLEGRIYLSHSMSDVMIHKFLSGKPKEGQTPLDCLTNRELEVFHFIGQGLSTNEIAKKFNLSVKTIETHKANIKTKLNVENATQLLRLAVEWNKLMEDSDTSYR